MPSAPPREIALLALRPLRHACSACGTCCHGWRVRVRPDELAGLERCAAELDVADPVVDGNLRQVEGRCVFLAEGGLCRIHARFGLAAKPEVCRRYPLRATLAEDGLRVGVDPSCASDSEAWETGPEVAPLRVVERDRRLAGERAAAELELLELAALPGLSVAELAAALLHEPEAPPELPQRFTRHVLASLTAEPLVAHLRDPRHGAALRARLEPVIDALEAWTPHQIPLWSQRLSTAQEAWALDTLRRHLFLRLGDPSVPPLGQTLLWLFAVTACGWAAPGAEFGPSLSAWLRVLRSPPVWGRLVPDHHALRRLLSDR